MSDHEPISLARALSARLGISVSSEEAETLYEHVLNMVTAGVQEGMQHARQECAQACDVAAALERNRHDGSPAAANMADNLARAMRSGGQA